VASDLEPIAWFEDGQGALFSHDRFLYLTGLPDDRWLEDLIKMAASSQNLPIVELPHGVRSRRLGVLRCFFNYNPFLVQLPGLEGLDVLVGSADLPPAGVLIGREERLE
jgi:beta-galactosidase